MSEAKATTELRKAISSLQDAAISKPVKYNTTTFEREVLDSALALLYKVYEELSRRERERG